MNPSSPQLTSVDNPRPSSESILTWPSVTRKFRVNYLLKDRIETWRGKDLLFSGTGYEGRSSRGLKDRPLLRTCRSRCSWTSGSRGWSGWAWSPRISRGRRRNRSALTSSNRWWSGWACCSWDSGCWGWTRWRSRQCRLNWRENELLLRSWNWSRCSLRGRPEAHGFHLRSDSWNMVNFL